MVNDLMLKAAMFYHDEGLNVIPVVYRDKKPALPAWEEYHTRLSTPEEIHHWFGNGIEHNLGIVHGEVSGNYVALDIDHDAGLLDSLRYLYPALFQGRVEQSGSGEGYHIPLRLRAMPDFGRDEKQGRPRGNRTWKTDLGILNIRARFCQTVAPPSIHPTGNRYKFIQKGPIGGLDSLDEVTTWMDKLAPPRTHSAQLVAPRSVRPAECDDLVTAVKLAWPSPLDVFREFGLVNQTQDDPHGELRLLGNGGLLISADRDRWYCFSDEMGGGAFEAWGYCRFGSRYDKRKHFRDVLLEMARAAGIDTARFYRRGDEAKVQPAPQLDRRHWSRQYEGYWERAR